MPLQGLRGKSGKPRALGTAALSATKHTGKALRADSETQMPETGMDSLP